MLVVLSCDVVTAAGSRKKAVTGSQRRQRRKSENQG